MVRPSTLKLFLSYLYYLVFKSYELSKFPNPIFYKMTVFTLILLKSMMHTLKQLLN